MDVIKIVKLGMVWHQNFIEDEINESYRKHPDVSAGFPGRMVFCKKLHKLTEPLESDCMECPYFAGLMGGYGHECAWEDVLEDKEVDGASRSIPWAKREKEMLRVSGLVAAEILSKW